MKSKLFPLLVPILSDPVVLTSCGQSDEAQQSVADNGVTVTNCGKDVTYAQADNLFVNDANIISMVLSVGAAEDVVEG
ncbi:iron transport system exported solute-binding protein [Corynebacterium diphtheriae]|nr:iron transport system exported solute-binding protein [Corynebacterium diphtheriae]CAB0494945.1 iron transport system exported solute-binding protein [Corynebacterium diphtheriae]CAB0495138.1 iron transport system exported solute-binding protein [Corynebacterium diphtheriae]CAB0877809.1 iron transport system exported solute-binding protein [Corynebacterium diphtheriae]CAB1031154.1 iron transport system exported solute-binding protein [Corynebacterium diphtheriae]